MRAADSVSPFYCNPTVLFGGMNATLKRSVCFYQGPRDPACSILPSSAASALQLGLHLRLGLSKRPQVASPRLKGRTMSSLSTCAWSFDPEELSVQNPSQTLKRYPRPPSRELFRLHSVRKAHWFTTDARTPPLPPERALPT